MSENTASENREKKKELFRNQKQLLDTFLEHGAISQAQYYLTQAPLGPAPVGDLIAKMGISEEDCRSE